MAAPSLHLLALVHVLAGPLVLRVRAEPGVATAAVASLSVDAELLASTVLLPGALVDISAGPSVREKFKSLPGAEAGVGAGSVLASVRAPAVVFHGALVHVGAVAASVLLVPLLALAVRGSRSVDAEMGALQLLLLALVHVRTSLPVALQVESLGAKAKDLKGGIMSIVTKL